MMVNIILDALTELDKSDQDTDQVSDQVKALLECMGDDELNYGTVRIITSPDIQKKLFASGV